MEGERESASVVVVIVSSDDGRWLSRCLDAVDGVVGVHTRTIVVLNECRDQSPAIAASHGAETVRLDRRVGFAEANNAALRYAAPAPADLVLFLNPDTVLAPTAVAELASFLAANPEFGCAGSFQCRYDDGRFATPNAWTIEVMHEAATMGHEVEDVGGRLVLEHYYVQAAAMAIPQRALENVGVFRSVYGTFYEEVDLCRRLRWAGLRTALVIDSRVQHAGGGYWTASAETRRWRDRLMLRNRWLYELSDPGRPAVRTALEVAVEQVRALRRGHDFTLGLRSYPPILAAVAVRSRAVRAMRGENRALIGMRHAAGRQRRPVGFGVRGSLEGRWDEDMRSPSSR
jgi:GT2 family glycosyltransferase